MDPVGIHVLGVPGTGALWILTVLSLVIFGWRMGRYAQALGRARPDHRLDHLGRRLQLFVVNVLGQRRLLYERIGIAHFLFFWGFVFYAGTFWWALARGLLPFLPVPYPEHLGLFATALDLLAIAVMAAIAASVARRVFFPPPHLHKSADAFIILGLIGMLMVTQVFNAAFQRVATPEEVSGWTPAAAALAGAFAGLDPMVAADWSVRMWWLHMITVLAFLAYLPYSKHLHLLIAPFGVFLGNLKPRGDLGVAGEDDVATNGAREWKDFTWRQLLSALSCAQCGRCDRACPCVVAGTHLSPQDMLQALKDHLLESALGIRSVSGHGNGNGGGNGEESGVEKKETGAPALLGGRIQPDALWACGTCMACTDRCPVFNEHLPIVVQLRRALVGAGQIDSALQEALTNLTRYGNSFGKSPRMRAKWTKDLAPKLKDASKEPVEFLWFVGDYASFDPRLQEATLATARVLQAAGLDVGILYDREQNSGNDVRRVGEEGLFQLLRDKNRDALGKAQFRAILTTDPHSYNTLKVEYAISGGGNSADTASPPGPGVAVLHVAELVDRLIQEGKLRIERPVDATVTYHDPCYLGRYNGVFDPPRRILRALGARVVEMPRNRNTSFCCGAGGGKIWMEDAAGSAQERPAESRVREAAALPGVGVLVTACPKDLIMFQDAIKTAGLEGKLVVRDLMDLLWEAMTPVAKEA